MCVHVCACAVYVSVCVCVYVRACICVCVYFVFCFFFSRKSAKLRPGNFSENSVIAKTLQVVFVYNY